MTKRKFKKAVYNSREKKVESLIDLMELGEELGEKLMVALSEFGSSMEGLIVETYAIAKAHGALKAIAEDKGVNTDNLYEGLLPSFLEEMREALKEK